MPRKDYVPTRLDYPKEPAAPRFKLTVIVLDCGHELRFKAYPPQPGDVVWCLRCGHFQECQG
jgi:hypothetical protein